MKVIAVTAALLCLLLAADTQSIDKETGMERIEENNLEEEKRQFFANLCERECTKLKCADYQTLSESEECTCISCDMGPVGDVIGRGKPTPTFDQIRINFNITEVNTTDNTNTTNNYKNWTSSEQDVETIMNRTCAMECSRLDCGSYTFDMNEERCTCVSCVLVEFGDNSPWVHAIDSGRIKRQLSFSYSRITIKTKPCDGHLSGRRCNGRKRVYSRLHFSININLRSVVQFFLDLFRG